MIRLILISSIFIVSCGSSIAYGDYVDTTGWSRKQIESIKNHPKTQIGIASYYGKKFHKKLSKFMFVDIRVLRIFLLSPTHTYTSTSTQKHTHAHTYAHTHTHAHTYARVSFAATHHSPKGVSTSTQT